MRNRKKITAVGVFISSLAMLLSAIGVFSGSTIALFIGSTAVFCATIAIYCSIRKKEENKEE